MLSPIEIVLSTIVADGPWMLWLLCYWVCSSSLCTRLMNWWNVLIRHRKFPLSSSLSGLLSLAYNSSDGPWVLVEYSGVDRLFLGVITSIYNCVDGWSVDHDGHSVSACSVFNLALTHSNGYPSL